MFLLRRFSRDIKHNLPNSTRLIYCVSVLCSLCLTLLRIATLREAQGTFWQLDELGVAKIYSSEYLKDSSGSTYLQLDTFRCSTYLPIQPSLKYFHHSTLFQTERLSLKQKYMSKCTTSRPLSSGTLDARQWSFNLSNSLKSAGV